MEPDSPVQSRPYLFQAKDASGKSIAAEVVADSTTSAMQLARAQGYSDVQILTEEVASFQPDPSRPGAPRPNPTDMVRYRARPGPWASRIHFVRLIYRPYGLLPLAGLLGIAACVLWSGSPKAYVLCAIPLVVPLLAPLVALSSKRPRNASEFRKIQTLYIDGRFDEVLKSIPRFEESMKGCMSDNSAAFAATEWRSKAMARLGRHDEAFAAIDHLAARPDITAAQAECLRMFAFGAARQYERVAESARRLQEFEPNNPTGYIAHAEVLAVWLDRPAEARAMLERARGLIVSKSTNDLFPMAEGEVLLAERRYQEARDALEVAAQVLRRQIAAVPYARPCLALVEMQLAIACAHLGDMHAARRHWRAAKPLATLHRMEPLVTRAERAVEMKGSIA